MCVKFRGKWHLPALWFSDFGQSPDVSQVSSDVGKKREVWKRSGFGCVCRSVGSFRPWKLARGREEGEQNLQKVFLVPGGSGSESP